MWVSSTTHTHNDTWPPSSHFSTSFFLLFLPHPDSVLLRVLFVLRVLRVRFVPLVLLGYNWNTECLHGLGAICLTVGNETRCPSVFAAPPLLGATFNRTVAHQLGEVGRREVERELGERDRGEGETEA